MAVGLTADSAEAIPAIEQWLAKEPCPPAWLLLARACWRAGDRDRARRCWAEAEAAQAQPRSAAFRDDLVVVALREEVRGLLAGSEVAPPPRDAGEKISGIGEPRRGRNPH